jgi:hypothetical protein
VPDGDIPPCELLVNALIIGNVRSDVTFNWTEDLQLFRPLEVGTVRLVGTYPG